MEVHSYMTAILFFKLNLMMIKHHHLSADFSDDANLHRSDLTVSEQIYYFPHSFLTRNWISEMRNRLVWGSILFWGGHHLFCIILRQILKVMQKIVMQNYAKVCKIMQNYTKLCKNFLKIQEIWNKFRKQFSNNNKIFQVIWLCS